MGKNHIKRLAAPKTWDIARKGIQFVVKPVPGPHGIEMGITLSTMLKEVFNCAGTTREVKKILHSREIKVDGRQRKDFRFPVGIFDTLDFTDTNEHFRVILDKSGKIGIIRIKKDEASIKPCKIIGKTIVRGKLQLNLYDGKNIFVDKGSYKVGDTIMLSLPEQKISKHLKLDKKSTIFLTGGKHIGEIGSVEDVVENRIIYKNKNNELVETLKDYAFVVGDSKPLIELE